MLNHRGCTTVTALLTLAVYGRTQETAHQPKSLWKPPSIQWPTTGAGGAVIHRLTVGDFAIVLDQTALQDVKRHLGGTIGSQGDAGDAEGWLCYRGADQAGSWIFWLTSAEINGDATGGFIWKRIQSDESADPRCKLIRGPDPIQLPFPLHLGISEKQVESIVGRPTSTRESESYYMHSVEEMIGGDTYTVSSGVQILSQDGVVTQLAGFEISSN